MTVDNLCILQSMSMGELKKELIDLGDPSFVFNDHDELVAALSSARKMRGVHDVIQASSTSSQSTTRKNKVHIAPTVIPTIDEESEAEHVHIDLGSNSNKKSFSKKNATSSMIEQDADSIRLVEYFIVVSSKPSDKSVNDINETNPLSGDETRVESRRAHLPGQSSGVNSVHLSSIGLRESLSTSSTCSSDDLETSIRGKDKNDIMPSANFQGMTACNDEYDGNLMKECVLQPVISARYPAEDRPDHPLNPRLPQFCHPEGSSEYIHPTTEYRMPRIHHFVLTESNAGKLYGTCLTVFEEYDVGATEESHETGKKRTYYAPRVLCLLSSWPYLSSFRAYLTQLYKLATTTDLMEAPIERYVLNICEEVPAPPPGSFEVQLNIMNNKIRFWAPPANQPIAYVSLPFEALFECLDIGNVLYTWYSLACEHKVLLVSDQLSLLTVCSEILCSLLFPMKWSHLYIPVLPRSLTPMLDAPMPYLCGISRKNFQYAVGDIGDDTVVVDLDRNVITLGSDPAELPPLPHKRRKKLENALRANGHVFWETRGLTKKDAGAIVNSQDREETLANAHSLWNERIRTIDDAFNLAPAPESSTMAMNVEATGKQSKWDAVQEAFLRFYVSALKDYRKYMPKDIATANSSWHDDKCRFKADDFVSSQRRDFQPFLEELMGTQMFEDFTTKCLYASGESDVIFFDKSIDAKKGRSLLNRKKTDVTYLNAADAHRSLQEFTAILPNHSDLSQETASKIGANGYHVYEYPVWPPNFNMSLFCSPRPIPKNIAREFEARNELKKKLSTITRQIRAERKNAQG